MQIWLFNQLVEETQSALARTHTQGSMQGPLSANHIKRHPSFIHAQDCLGDLLIYEGVPIEPPSPGADCVLPLFPSHGLKLQMGILCLALGCVAYSAINPTLWELAEDHGKYVWAAQL